VTAEVRALVKGAFVRLLADTQDGHIAQDSALAARAMLARALVLDRAERKKKTSPGVCPHGENTEVTCYECVDDAEVQQ